MRSLSDPCKVVTAAFFALIVAIVSAAILNVVVLNFVQDVMLGGPVDEARVEAIDAAQALIGIIEIVLRAICAASFLWWLYRAYKNLSLDGSIDLRSTPGWAVGCFFVPFVNLFMPFQRMKEVWIGSRLLAMRSTHQPTVSRESTAPVGWWWGLFLTSSLIDNIAAELLLAAEILDEFFLATRFLLAGFSLELPAAIVCLYIVRRVTAFQETAQRERRHDTGVVAGA